MPSLNLAQLIEEAAAGATLELPAGVHKLSKPLTLDKTLTLKGAGRAETTITGSGAALLHFEGEGALGLAHLTCAWKGKGKDEGDVLRCTRGEVRLEDCDLLGATAAETTGGVALRAWEEGRVTAVDCGFRDNSFGAVQLSERAQGEFDRIQVSGGVMAVIAVGDSRLELRDSTFDGEPGKAVFTGNGTANATITNSTFDGCKMAVCSNGGTLVVSNCTVKGAATQGYYFLGQADVRMTGGSITGCGSHGLFVKDSARCDVTGADVQKNTGCGALYRASSSGTLRGNTFAGHRGQVGICIDGEAKLVLEGNTCRQNANGVQLNESAQVEMRENTLEKNTLAGVNADGQAHLEARDNHASRNKASGFSITDTAEALLEDNHAEGNAHYGVIFLGDARGRVLNNHLTGNRKGALYPPHLVEGPGRPDRLPNPPERSMSELLEAMDAWFGTHRPDYATRLAAGASDGELDALAAALGVTLAPDLRALFAWHNGEKDTYEDSFHYVFRLISLAECQENHAVLAELADAGEFELDDWWHPGWIPFLDNGAGDMFCVDLDGAFGGVPGQVLQFWHDSEERTILAPSLASWIAAFLGGLEADMWATTDDLFEPRDLDAWTAFEAAALPGYPIQVKAQSSGDEPKIVASGNVC